MNWTIIGSTTPGNSEPRGNGTEGVVHTSQISRGKDPPRKKGITALTLSPLLRPLSGSSSVRGTSLPVMAT